MAVAASAARTPVAARVAGIDAAPGGPPRAPAAARVAGPRRDPWALDQGLGAGWPGCSGPIRYGRIISLSSCSRMWQCQTYWPACAKCAFTRVISPGYARTVSLRPASHASGPGPTVGSHDRAPPVLLVVGHQEPLAVDDLELHLVDVDGVRVRRGVVDLPGLGVADDRGPRSRGGPRRRSTDQSRHDGAELRLGGSLDLLAVAHRGLAPSSRSARHRVSAWRRGAARCAGSRRWRGGVVGSSPSPGRHGTGGPGPSCAGRPARNPDRAPRPRRARPGRGWAGHAPRGGRRAKSTIRSARSAGPRRTRPRCSLDRSTGRGRKPPSLPICHTPEAGIAAKSRIRARDWQPFRTRKR